MSRKTVPPPGEIKRLKLLVVAATAMIAVVIICGGAIGIRISGLLVDVSDDWTHYQETAHRKAIYLSDIRRAFGYGGFIHNFKNYVLRRQDRYLMLAERDMQRLQVAIAGYRTLPLSSWEATALDNVAITAQDYTDVIDVARQHVARGSLPTAIDADAKVADELAIAALDNLETVWQQARESETARITEIVSEGLLSVNSGIVLVPVLVACAAVFFWLLRELTSLTAEKIHAERELRELDELKNRFLGMAAHDLRNPLNVIQGMSHMIMLLKLSDQKKTDLIKTIHEVSHQMLSLLNDLLDISAIESGKFTLEAKPGDITKAVEKRIDLMALNAEAKGISIVSEFDEVPLVSFDGERISQVLDNLLSNAIKFSPADTVIRVSVDAANGAAHIAVRDQGPGIPPGEKDKLFGTFEKLSVQPTAGEKSTGLGLAIVKKIVEAHSGTVTVLSEVGSGSTFTVSLPIAEPAGEGDIRGAGEEDT